MRLVGPRYGMVIVAALGLLLGAGLTLYVLSQLGPEEPAATPPPPQRADLTVRFDRALFVREANRQIADVLARYDLRDPRWLFGADNTLTLLTTGRVPIVGEDVEVRIEARPVVRGGGAAVEILRITYGSIEVSGEQLAGLADDLNAQLAAALDRDRFRVEDARVTPDAIVVQLRVIGRLAPGGPGDGTPTPAGAGVP